MMFLISCIVYFGFAEGESDETVQSMVNSNRCRRCGCAVRGQCDNPSSLIEPDKIIIITNSSSASTSQMTVMINVNLYTTRSFVPIVRS